MRAWSELLDAPPAVWPLNATYMPLTSRSITMRHQKAGRKFKRSPSHRRMLLRNLATALLEHGKIQTTLAKAKEVQPFTEKLITLAKDGWNLDHFRRCLAVLTSKEVAFKLFHEIGPRYKERSGGYTRIYKLAKVRQGDAAPMAVIALLGENEASRPRPSRPLSSRLGARDRPRVAGTAGQHRRGQAASDVRAGIRLKESVVAR